MWQWQIFPGSSWNILPLSSSPPIILYLTNLHLFFKTIQPLCFLCCICCVLIKQYWLPPSWHFRTLSTLFSWLLFVYLFVSLNHEHFELLFKKYMPTSAKNKGKKSNNYFKQNLLILIAFVTLYNDTCK